jgi:hypothetical protein
MVYVQRDIGGRFERYLQRHFPGLKSHVSDGEKVPDFFNPQSGFWMEAKVGNIGWGVRLKRYQGENFQGIEQPVIYCLGLHNFDDARKRLKGKKESERRDILRREMNILEVYFITGEIIDAVLEQESRLNGKETIEYCMMKRHICRDIIRDRSFRRHGVLMPTAEGFYGYDRSQFDFYDLSKPRPEEVVPVRGVVLHKIKDRVVTDYLRRQQII